MSAILFIVTIAVLIPPTGPDTVEVRDIRALGEFATVEDCERAAKILEKPKLPVNRGGVQMLELRCISTGRRKP